MQHVIVGFLLGAIIVIGGWLIYFYNKMANQKILVDDSREQLNLHLQRRDCLLIKMAATSSLPEAELRELDERIEVCRYIYNDSVSNYNSRLAAFPGNVSGIILGLNVLPDIEPEIN